MALETDLLPLEATIEPDDQAAIAQAIAEASRQRSAVYPIGGGTSLHYGLPPRQPGIGLALGGVAEVIDYPSRDLTITVEAGITMAKLAETLAQQQQWLPIDAPLADRATLGGMVATNTSGPRRMTMGTLRDHVIGIRAVDGRGIAFQGGGRVVKNVAGYDFCKLLTGSLGTLGVITQVTLKVKPLPVRSVLAAVPVSNATQAAAALRELFDSPVTPSAVEWLSGPAWSDLFPDGCVDFREGGGLLAVGLEGTEVEVDWMIDRLTESWQAQQLGPPALFTARAAEETWTRLADFPAAVGSPLTVKICVRRSAILDVLSLVCRTDPGCSFQAHAGSGVAVVHFAEPPEGDIGGYLVRRLQPLAVRHSGSVVVLRCDAGELTRQAVWGSRSAAVDLMESVRRAFDPNAILNPKRFIY
jgi:glycolate oxidase FAD binding subunit